MINYVNLGTTIISLKYINGIIIGSDSKVNIGSFISNRNSDKVFQLSKFIVCCRSGKSADNQNLCDKLKNYVIEKEFIYGRHVLVREVVQFIKTLMYNCNLECTMICAGWDCTNGFQNYLITNGGGLIQKSIIVNGGGSNYISGLIDNNFNETMSLEECEKLITKSLSIAINKDTRSGGIIRLTYISSAGMIKKCFLPY
ncbi:26S proteasome, beta-1 SU [Guillardia theta]|uniref:Proteasome subunit beta n=1 Tax=Guillardia theta TaxID=55529 RepID=Q9AW13_GUITH|nr:26S proteasome, beta-1 SU [Guillardia theta]CAC27058.1 26S proteasome, beta-1 SU [Guillardia theta]|mmetsp:Transcript_23970/g.77929  ORF Transcript_23970/g.77929 Transcript_23970/m.77929 type:complete len:199 (-) Transcript_23970:490-1086(-)